MVYVAEAEAELKRTDVADARVVALDQHGYDISDFDESMRLLTENPELAKKIYQAVLDSVILEQRDIRATTLTEEGVQSGVPLTSSHKNR